MEITRTKNDNTEVIGLIGRLDVITSPKLQTALLEVVKTAENIELDFAEVDYVASAGLRVLLHVLKIVQKDNKSMVLKNVSAEVTEVFDVTGFLGILTIV